MKTDPQTHPVSFSPWRLARLSSYRIGSAMVEILATSIWNRVMISTLGLPATWVGLLLGMRYLLAPLSLWIGHRSDTVPLWGYYRTSYIWLGRLLVVLCLPLLPLSLSRLEIDPNDNLGWGLAVGCFALYTIGSVLSGSPFLALVRDSAPHERQGLSISINETAFIILIALAGIGFAQWIGEEYTPTVFWQMVVACMVVGAFFWFFAVYGVEKASIPPHIRTQWVQQRPHPPNFSRTFAKIWGDRRTRLFFFFLSFSTLAAWMQDTILEPFGDEVLGLAPDATTRFTSYWQGGTVLTLVGGAYLWRRRPSVRQVSLAGWGLLFMGLGMGLIAAVAFWRAADYITLALLIFGGGFGVHTFASLSLMAVMSSDEEAGAYLGLWTISILVFKGLGTFLGGALRDLFFLVWGWPVATAYGLAFVISAVGLLASISLLRNLDVAGFARDANREDEALQTVTVEA